MMGPHAARARALLALLALLTALSLAATQRDAQRAPSPTDTSPIDPRSLVVRAADTPSLDGIAREAAALGFVADARAAALPAARFAVPSSMTLPEAIIALSSMPRVVYVEPLYTMASADVPLDPLYTRQRTYLEAVSAPAAWDIEQGQPHVIVAVLDTGIDLGHPDLAGRIWTNPAEIAANGIDDDANGCIDDLNGCAYADIVEPACEPAINGDIDDDLGHGTFVAGVIAANGDNNVGMVGVARNVTLLPVKMLDCEGHGNSLALAQAILYAANAGARVINVSLGGPADSLIVREAVRVATDDFGVLIVAATGNTGESGVSYPARYDQVLAVGAATTDDPDERAEFSSHGPEVDVVAVGEKIVGPVPEGACPLFLACIGEDYASGDGTSFAAPQAAGLAALIISLRPDLPPRSVYDLIKASADPVPPGDRPNWAGAGRINMLHALQPQYRLGTPGVAKN